MEQSLPLVLRKYINTDRYAYIPTSTFFETLLYLSYCRNMPIGRSCMIDITMSTMSQDKLV